MIHLDHGSDMQNDELKRCPYRHNPEPAKVDLNDFFRSGKYMPFDIKLYPCTGRHVAMIKLMAIALSIIQRLTLQQNGNCSFDKVTNLTMELKSRLMLSLKTI